MKSIGITLSKYRRRFLYKYYKFQLIKYIIKYDHDWDYYYLLKLIYEKLTNIALVIRKEEITMSDKQIAHEMWTARKLLKKVLNFDYEEKYYDMYNKKIEKEFGYQIYFDAEIHDHTLHTRHLPLYDTGLMKYTDVILPDSFSKAEKRYEEYVKLYHTDAFNEQKNDLKKFFEYIIEHIWEWAD